MLLIGSRAVARHFTDARRSLDWDVVVTAAEAEVLASALPLLPGLEQKKGKLVLLHDGCPLEAVVEQAGDPWALVRGLCQETVRLPVLGEVLVPPPDVLLLLKESHIHLAAQWRKTARDVSFLRGKKVRIPGSLADLLEALRVHAEARWSRDRRAFPERGRLCELPRTRACAHQHRALHEIFGAESRGPSPSLDPARPGCLTALPTSDGARIRLLAEEIAVHAVQAFLWPTRRGPGARWSAAGEREAAWCAADDLCTRVFAREVRLGLAPHADAAIASLRPGFAARLARAFEERAPSLASSGFYQASGEDDELAIVRKYVA